MAYVDLPKGSTDLITLSILRENPFIQRMKTYTLACLKMNLEIEKEIVNPSLASRGEGRRNACQTKYCKSKQRQGRNSQSHALFVEWWRVLL